MIRSFSLPKGFPNWPCGIGLWVKGKRNGVGFTTCRGLEMAFVAVSCWRLGSLLCFRLRLVVLFSKNFVLLCNWHLRLPLLCLYHNLRIPQMVLSLLIGEQACCLLYMIGIFGVREMLTNASSGNC